VKKAVCHYIAEDYDGDDYPLANMTTYMGIVKKLSTFESRWKKVTKDNFKPKPYCSHQHLVDTVKNYLRSEKIRDDVAKLLSVKREAKDRDAEEEEEEEMEEEDDDEASQIVENQSARFVDSDFKDSNNIPKSGRISPKKFDLADTVIGLGKRSPTKDLDDPVRANKIVKLEEVEVHFNDMVMYQNCAKASENAWRKARDSLSFIKTPPVESECD
jgi:hypothetical protein